MVKYNSKTINSFTIQIDQSAANIINLMYTKEYYIVANFNITLILGVIRL